ncbi:lactoylglutathione lyase [Halobacteriales archaeon QS_4_69_34]|nr:MAG: lactoylglutathione lyase [Halobacteriales archaeon QS_4_69_34]
MDVRTIDHVNLRLPTDGIDAAVEFYGDRLGFAIEGLDRHERGEQSFFDVRLAPAHVVHLWATTAFEPPSGNGFDHVALLVEADIETVKERLAAADVTIESELESPLGATGRTPSVYVEDPFGYRIELKAATE